MPESARSTTSGPTVQAPSPLAGVGTPAPLPGQLELWLRCYAPFKSFGGGYDGDAREESTDVTKTSRVVFVLTIDYARMSMAKPATARCDESHGRGLFPMLMSLPAMSAAGDWRHGVVTGRGNARFTILTEPVGRPGQGLAAAIHVWAGNPLVPIAPDIDVQLNLKLKKDVDTALLASGNLMGDAFPNSELFLRDATGRTSLLHAYRTPGGIYGPFSYLPGSNTRPMGAFGKRLKTTSTGLLTQ